MSQMSCDAWREWLFNCGRIDCVCLRIKSFPNKLRPKEQLLWSTPSSQSSVSPALRRKRDSPPHYRRPRFMVVLQQLATSHGRRVAAFGKSVLRVNCVLYVLVNVNMCASAPCSVHSPPPPAQLPGCLIEAGLTSRSLYKAKFTGALWETTSLPFTMRSGSRETLVFDAWHEGFISTPEASYKVLWCRSRVCSVVTTVLFREGTAAVKMPIYHCLCLDHIFAP